VLPDDAIPRGVLPDDATRVEARESLLNYLFAQEARLLKLLLMADGPKTIRVLEKAFSSAKCHASEVTVQRRLEALTLTLTLIGGVCAEETRSPM